MTCCPTVHDRSAPAVDVPGTWGKQESESERKSGEESRGEGEKRGGKRGGTGGGGGGERRGRVNPLLIFRVTLSTGSESPATGDFQTTASEEEKKMRRPAGDAAVAARIEKDPSICDRSTRPIQHPVECCCTFTYRERSFDL
ncbi:hypothetical protein ALC62_01212 [Cyphomyrmex costatus]|uniref:Uncharacterized protein n=1 Tax=Cyphomyrmex costatus TaxID=456900 RepID=A0A195D4D6_9HYME|nr:hypothetical protein ALC62_01212 [Cyphomyrmex costatus]